MKINVIGSIFGITGYDSHAKGLVNALFKLNPNIKLDVPLPQNWVQQVNDAELAMIKQEPRVPDVTIALMTPPNWRLALGDNCGSFVGYCVWEGNKCPLYWTEYFMDERVDQIWVPSIHTKDAILNTDPDLNEYYEDKIRVVPHGYDPEVFKQIETLHIQNKSTFNKTFKIICNKGWRGGMEDRGGVQFLLQAYSQEFTKDENIELLLKLNPSYINPQLVKAKIDELKLPKECGKIKIACGNLSPKQLCDLYNDSDLYVCATRAESFDLGTAEAMACGLPIITTGYGGQIEHMDKTCADFIDYELAEVKGDVMYEGIKQAVPNIPKLRELLRESFIQRDKTKEKGVKAKDFIKDWTWDSTAKIAMNFLQ